MFLFTGGHSYTVLCCNSILIINSYVNCDQNLFSMYCALFVKRGCDVRIPINDIGCPLLSQLHV